MIITNRLYNREFEKTGIYNVIKWEFFEIKSEKIIITFEGTNSPHRQGIFLRADSGIEIEEVVYKSVFLWFDSAPRVVTCKPLSSNKMCDFYNIWERNGERSSQSFSSGMLAEPIDNGFRYHCNDIGFESDFSKLIFTVQNVV